MISLFYLTRIVVKYIINDNNSCQMKGEMDMPLLNKLKELRSAKGLNQQDLGSLVGVSRQTISLIERGDYNPSITVCLKLSKILGVSVEEIFIYEEEIDE